MMVCNLLFVSSRHSPLAAHLFFIIQLSTFDSPFSKLPAKVQKNTIACSKEGIFFRLTTHYIIYKGYFAVSFQSNVPSEAIPWASTESFVERELL